MKKFRARFSQIEEFEIIKETEKQVVYINEYKRENREAKTSDWSSWHNTREAAVNYLISKKQLEIDRLLTQVGYKKNELEKIKNL